MSNTTVPIIDRSADPDAPTSSVTFSGGGFRAIMTRADVVEWSCEHVHFTDRSARNCAERHVSDIASHA